MTNAKKDQDLAEEALDKVNSEPGTGSTTNKQKYRHRASVACASCRDRRIRVRLDLSCTVLVAGYANVQSVLCHKMRLNAHSANDLELNASSETTTNEDGTIDGL